MSMATGEKVAAFARRTRTNRSTLTKWQADPEFRKQVRRVRQELLDESVGILSGALEKAAAGMAKLAVDAVSEAVRLQAQRSVLTSLSEMTELAELKDRLQALEERFDQMKENGVAPGAAGTPAA